MARTLKPKSKEIKIPIPAITLSRLNEHHKNLLKLQQTAQDAINKAKKLQSDINTIVDCFLEAKGIKLPDGTKVNFDPEKKEFTYTTK